MKINRVMPVLAVSLVLAASACANSSAASASAGAKAKTVTTGQVPNLESAKLPATTNICDLLPAATVAQITGTKFDTGAPDSTPSYQLYSCTYSSTSAVGAELDVSVEGLDAPQGYQADVDTFTSTGNTPVDISGLGDKAFSTTIAGGAVGQIDALFGAVLITANGLSTMTTDQGKQLITTLHSKIGS
jgi:hypothetical protein